MERRMLRAISFRSKTTILLTFALFITAYSFLYNHSQTSIFVLRKTPYFQEITQIKKSVLTQEKSSTDSVDCSLSCAGGRPNETWDCTENFVHSPFYSPLLQTWEILLSRYQLPGPGYPDGERQRFGYNFRVPAATLRRVLPQLSGGLARMFREECRRCVIVGHGGSLRKFKLGPVIDSYPVVIRLNSGPIKGYEKLVGSKTDVRLLYMESAPKSRLLLPKNTHVISMLYNPPDIEWTYNSMMNDTILRDFENKTREIVRVVDKDKWSILNPKIHEVLEKLVFRVNASAPVKRPTIGTVAIYTALHLCGTVDVAGFGFDSASAGDFWYYYGSKNMSSEAVLYNSGTHNTDADAAFRRKLKCAGLINDDLTNSLGSCPT